MFKYAGKLANTAKVQQVEMLSDIQKLYIYIRDSPENDLHAVNNC